MIKYGDKVRVKSGFYEGCEGVAIDCELTYFYPTIVNKIMVEFISYVSYDCHIFKKEFNEEELEKIDEKVITTKEK